MKALVIGSGGREHAIVKGLLRSPSIREVHVLPGNSGMKREALCHEMDWHDMQEVVALCRRAEIDFVFIGPEDPLVAGLSDFLRDHGILTVGPSQEAAQLEGSKVFSKEFMKEYGIPTADFIKVESVAQTMEAAKKFKPPYVLKADGLAAGKGVSLCSELDELELAAQGLFERKVFGDAGKSAVLEAFLPGSEMSLLVMTDGKEFELLPVAQDHKRLYSQTSGPNTGGMGAVAPVNLSEDLRTAIEETIIKPTLVGMQKRSMIYRGILFIGLMIKDKKPYVIEYNTRMGDPETQVVLPLLDNDLGIVFRSLAMGKLEPLKWKNMYSCCVVMAAQGYPLYPKKGDLIKGNIKFETPSSYFIHAGTATNESGHFVVKGGRVLGAIGLGSTRQEAITNAYEQANKVEWSGLQMRTDIGQHVGPEQ